MNKKVLFTLLLISLLVLSTCYSFAATGVGNAIKDAGNTAGNLVSGATGAIVDGTKNLTNSASNMMNNMTNANGDKENDATNTLATNDGIFDTNTNGDNYTATRTATDNGNMLGMSGNTWTWLIVGIAGMAIISLVWYYGAQYEHRNYND